MLERNEDTPAYNLGRGIDAINETELFDANANEIGSPVLSVSPGDYSLESSSQD